jgi:hypothetical protein
MTTRDTRQNPFLYSVVAALAVSVLIVFANLTHAVVSMPAFA